LIDEPAKYFLDGALKKSHDIRVKYHRVIWNGGLLFLFVAILAGFLYYRYKTRPSQAEINHKLIKDQEYVLSKIRYFQEQQQRIHQSDKGAELTGLPVLPGR
jgi:hypothetical protein